MKDISDVKRKALQSYLDTRLEEYEAISKQLTYTVVAVDRLRFQRQMDDLERSIQELQIELGQLVETGDTSENSSLVNKLEILRNLNFGRAVAEQDDLLLSCFVPNPALREIVTDRADIVLGAKGSGKSAIWVEIQNNKKAYYLDDVFIAVATNPKGDPEFRDVLAAIDRSDYPSEDDLRLAWRLYCLSQIWKAVRSQHELESKELSEIGREIRKYGLVSESSNLKREFAFAIAKARALKKLGAC